MSENTVTTSTDVRVAIVGVGNCASSLVQGVQYYACCRRELERPA